MNRKKGHKVECTTKTRPLPFCLTKKKQAEFVVQESDIRWVKRRTSRKMEEMEDYVSMKARHPAV